VVFDGDAGTWVSDGGTQWYDTNHYLTVVTDAYDVSPALSSSAPSLADAQARVALLAADGASYVVVIDLPHLHPLGRAEQSVPRRHRPGADPDRRVTNYRANLACRGISARRLRGAATAER
jgi:hypothetical protein